MHTGCRPQEGSCSALWPCPWMLHAATHSSRLGKESPGSNLALKKTERSLLSRMDSAQHSTPMDYQPPPASLVQQAAQWCGKKQGTQTVTHIREPVQPANNTSPSTGTSWLNPQYVCSPGHSCFVLTTYVTHSCIQVTRSHGMHCLQLAGTSC